MNSVYSADLGSALFGMFADISSDIILKTDRNGFIVQATPGLRELGVKADDLLILPHIADLADPRFATGVREYVSLALRGKPLLDCAEFPLAKLSQDERADQQVSSNRVKQDWFALRLRPAPGDDGALGGGMGMLRSISKPHATESHRIDSGLVDQLTGLGNQRSLFADVTTRSDQGRSEAIVLVEIDSFRSLSHRHGPSSVEQMICAFAEFLLVMLGDRVSLTRLSDARFAFLLDNQDPYEAGGRVDELVRTFAQLSSGLTGDGPAITASAGLAQISSGATEAISSAEKALILAIAAGGSQVKIAEDMPHYLTRQRCNV